MRVALILILGIFLAGCAASDPEIMDTLLSYDRAHAEGNVAKLKDITTGISAKSIPYMHRKTKRHGVTRIVKHKRPFYTWFGKAEVPILLEYRDSNGRPFARLPMTAKLIKDEGRWKVTEYDFKR
jgi:hypothetical protein